MNNFRFIFAILSIVLPTGSTRDEPHIDLASILPEELKTYDKLVPPVVEKDENDPLVYDPAIVKIRVIVLSINSIDEEKMSFTADVFLIQTWKDHRLRFPNLTVNYVALDVAWLKDIWRPDAYFRNARSIKFQTMTVPNHYLLLYADKTLSYEVELELQLSCVMDLTFYPHDIQNCALQIESFTTPETELKFQWFDVLPILISKHFNDNFKLAQMELTDAHQADCRYGNFSCLEVVFVLKRRICYFLINTYIPTCLIVIISWISFWIEPEAIPARVTLGVTSLLTLSAQHAKSLESLPRVSYLKMVDVFMVTNTVFVFMVLVEMCMINLILRDSRLANKLVKDPAKADSSSFRSVSRSNDQSLNPSISSMNECPSVDLEPSPNVNIDSKSTHDRHQRALSVDRVSRVLFPVLFVLANCIYWLCVLFY